MNCPTRKDDNVLLITIIVIICFVLGLSSCKVIFGPSECMNCTTPGGPTPCMEDGHYIPRTLKASGRGANITTQDGCYYLTGEDLTYYEQTGLIPNHIKK